ncbi:DUF3828 domain-containing protein [Cronobacter muytjensii]|uniref:DUF3828 domain-containing protein n=1 Tax=Cronobacter muytjensii TaxID=413501 RepID=UPI0034A04AC5
MNWNKDVAISHLRSRALGHSHNECATFTREAIAAGGIRLERTLNAKDYGLHYFAYARDYDPSWVSALTVGAARPFMGGEVMPVWIGREGGKN